MTAKTPEATEVRDFPTDVVLTLATGDLVAGGGFDPVHEAAEFVLGHPIWMHEFAERELWQRLADCVASQHPDFKDVDTSGLSKETWREWVAAQIGRVGATVTLRRGNAKRTESPIESAQRLAPGRPIIVLDASGVRPATKK